MNGGTMTVAVAAEQEILGNALMGALQESGRLSMLDLRMTPSAGEIGDVLDGQPELDAAVLSFRTLTATGVAEMRSVVERAPHVGVAILCDSMAPEAIVPIKEWLGVRRAGFGLMQNSSLSSNAEFVQFVISVVDGRYVLDKEASQSLLTAERFVPSESLSVLTARELRVLELASHGYHNDAIGASLGIRRATVERYMHNIYTKLGNASQEVSPRANAVRLFNEAALQSE
jgi:DNA-binding NarL/FixJ family response regulator